MIMDDKTTADGRKISGPSFKCEGRAGCPGAPKVWLADDGRWLCRACLERTGATVASPTSPSEPTAMGSMLR